MAETNGTKAESTTDETKTTESTTDEAKTESTTDETKTESTTDDTKPESTEPTELEQKIIRQVEYYFGDINLARDKFLHQQIKEDDGWVSLEVLTTFNRLKQLSEDKNVIAEALKKSKSGLLQVDKENTKIRRDPSKPLPEYNKERKDDLKSRTIYARNIPRETGLDEVEAFFTKYGSVEHITMRKDDDKKFKGSVFVLFVDQSSVEKFLKEEGTKFPKSEVDLIKVTKEDYWRSKTEEKKKQREEELKEKEETMKRKEEEEEEDFKKKMTKGAILVLDGVPKDVRRDAIKEQFKNYGTCSWVDLDEEKAEARLRFDQEGSASEVLEKAKEEGGGSVKVEDTEVKARVLEGEEECEHWKKMFQDMRAKKNKDRSKKGRGRFGGGPPKKKARRE